MATEIQIGPIETSAPSATAILESMTSEERATWDKTGEIPVRPQGESTTSATPATVAKSGPEETPVEVESESKTDKGTQETEKEKPASRGDKRILELLGKNKALEAELEELRKPKVEVKAEVKPESAPGKPSSPVVIPDALKAKIKAVVEQADQFETYEDMISALIVETVQMIGPDVVESKLKQKEEAQQAAKAQEKISEKWMKSVKDAAGKHTDYEAAVDSPEMAKLIPVGSMLNSLLVDSELGGEILYHLATHKDEIKRISVLPPIAQAREVFKLETTLSGSPVQTETEEAPPPPRSLGSGEILPANAVTAALQAKDAGAYMKAANEEDKKRLKK
jgi:hypothetical protein